MTLPVSSYEELLVQVRELTHETILLRRQLSSDLFENVDPTDLNHNLSLIQNHYEKGKLVSENVLRHCDQNHKIGPEAITFCDRRSFPDPNPPTTDEIETEELSAKLIACRNQRRNSNQEVEGNEERFDSQGQQPSKQRLNSSSEHPSVVATISASSGRVGVEGSVVSNSLESNNIQQDSGLPKTRGSSESLSWSQRNTVDEFPIDPRSRSINGAKSRIVPPTVHRTKPQNVMEPEHKEELDHESGTPSPEFYGTSVKGYENDASSEDESRPSSSLQTQRLSSLYHGTWPVKRDVWNNQQFNFNGQQSTSTIQNEMASIMSFSSTSGSSTGIQSHRRLGAKVDVVYSLLGMLGRSEGREDMSATLLSMSNSVESCRVMRQSGCLPLLVQLIHAPGQDAETRERAARALHNIVQARSDERSGRREVRVLRLLEQLRDYCQTLRSSLETGQPRDDLERHPGATIAALMKLSFDEDHRHAMCQLGGLHAVSELIEMDHSSHGSECDDPNCITLRRYAGMALTNLTFGDGNNKALLCSFKNFMRSLVSQLRSPSDDLRQVTASVLRNLSWRADSSSKQTLREVGAVIGLMRAAMEGKKESTLKSILSALWNLSAHCSTNKVDICAVEGALAFLVDMLSYKAPSKNFAIVENAGGILRNVSSHIAVRDDYRAIVRERGCLQVLLRQLRSPSLTIVSNACGALWNLSARCPQDQRLLWDLGAVPMLRSLVHSKHKMISMGSSAALKNLLSARPGSSNLVHLDSTARGLGLSTLPSLVARRQKALEQEIDQSLAETCENIEPSTSPVNKDDKFSFKVDRSYQPGTSGLKPFVPRSESRESIRSVTSTHSDTIFEKVNRHALNGVSPIDLQMKQQSASLHSAVGFDLGSQSERKYALKYNNSAPGRTKSDDDDLKRTGSTISWATPDHEAALNASIEDKLSQVSSCEFSFTKSEDPGEKQDLLRMNGSLESRNLVQNGAASLESKNLNVQSQQYAEKLKNAVLSESPFCDYAETDLDQTTDYSLRYAEQTSDDEKQSSAYFTSSEQNVLNGDTVKTYCTEGTPSQLSLNSSRATSASDLQEDIRPRSLFRTIAGNSRIPGHHFTADEQITSGEDSGAASYRSLTIDDEHKIADDSKHKEFERKLRKTSSPCPVNQISEDDDDDDDQGLLAACINIGMQNNRHRQSFRRNSLEEDSQGECNLTRYQTSNELNRVDNTIPSNGETVKNSRYSMQEIAHDFSTNELSSAPKKQITPEAQIPKSSSNSTEKIPELDRNSEEIVVSGSCDSFDSVERSEQALLEFCIQSRISKVTNGLVSTSQEKQKSYDLVDAGKSAPQLQIEASELIITEENTKIEEVYRRQRDPDAMIASLDRLTATLVQQTEAMREKDSYAMKQSVQSESWNEDSPNDVSFPSISVSAPLIASFKSDIQDEAAKVSTDTVMTDSKIIQQEAIKIAEVVSAEANNSEYDSIKISSGSPPSLSYITAPDFSETYTVRDRCFSICSPGRGKNQASSSRKKSLPIGVVAKRALNYAQNHTNSLENLSQLENVKPPSMMDEVLDIGDMENSMISVASITSEIADAKDDSHSFPVGDSMFDLVKPVANVLSMTCLRYAESLHISGNNSLSECLENINPPSLFNEVTEMDESTIEGNSDTLCSETLCIDIDFRSEEAPHLIDRIDEVDNDTDEATTPIPSEYCSSAESTPKKRLRGHLTPKQKRQLAKERYKTYTIAAEIVKKEEDRRKLEMTESGKKSLPLKLTPKQRRQEDRNRFQTQVLENRFEENPIEGKRVQAEGNRFQTQVIKSPVNCQEVAEKVEPTPVKSGIPMLRKFSRERGKDDRYRTRTINEVGSQDQVHTMLEQNANIVLNSLNETTKGDEMLLDCETLSLVSNESGSEHFLQMRFTNGDCKRGQQESRTRVFNYEADIREAFRGNGQDPARRNVPEVNGAGSQGNVRELRRSNSQEPIRKNNPDEAGILENQGLRHVQDVVNFQGVSKGNEVRNVQETSRGITQELHRGKSQELTRGNIQELSRGKTQELNRTKSLELNRAKSQELNRVEGNSGDYEEFESEEEDSDQQQIKGPKIVKPGTISRDVSLESNASEPEIPKGIRGRRKPLYSNPTTKKPTPQSSPSKQVKNSAIPIGRSNTSPIVRATRATTLRQNNNTARDQPKSTVSPKHVSSAEKKSALSKRSSIPQKGSSLAFTKAMKRHSAQETPMKPLERQGTFTKDEPEVENAPTVPSLPSSPAKTRIAKPIGKSLIVKPKVQNPLNSKVPSLIPSKKSQVESSIPKKVVSLGQRSNSNSSIQTPQGKKTKEATSKIASLWKKVEDSKLKQRFEKPDTRKWITGNGTLENDADNSPAFDTDSSDFGADSSAFRLFRSSTFDGMPKTISDSSTISRKAAEMCNGVKFRNSCDLSGIPVKHPEPQQVILRNARKSDASELEIDITKRISRLGSFIRVDESSNSRDCSAQGVATFRTTASAIVPPFNYNPYPENSAQNPKEVEVQNFKSDIITASARVTTV